MTTNLYFLLGSSATGSAAGAAGGGAGAMSLLPFALIFLVMYLLIIRPQSKRQKEHKNMLANVTKGDKVITAGGLHGTIAQVNERTVILKVDDNTKLEFSKESIATILRPKTDKDTAQKTSKDAIIPKGAKKTTQSGVKDIKINNNSKDSVANNTNKSKDRADSKDK